jgi:hypothetical protein
VTRRDSTPARSITRSVLTVSELDSQRTILPHSHSAIRPVTAPMASATRSGVAGTVTTNAARAIGSTTTHTRGHPSAIQCGRAW